MNKIKKQLCLVMLIIVSILSCSKKTHVDDEVMNENYHYWENKDAVISPVALENLMKENTNLIIIGTINPKKMSVPFSIESKPIKDSYIVWRNDYSGYNENEAVSKHVGGVIKDKEEMESLLSKAGVETNSTIVVYSSSSMHDAGRLYWQLKLLGLENVKILDGGLNAWSGPTDKAIFLDEEDIKTDVKFNEYDRNMLATIDDVILALEDTNNYIVIDTRTYEEYDGKETSSSKGAYGVGAIKNTIHIPWNEVLNENNTLKSREEIEKIYSQCKGKKIVAFCQSGVRSAYTYYVLKEVLGIDNVRNYDGSWIEWSYVASDVSKDVNEELKEKVLSHTARWVDNNGII